MRILASVSLQMQKVSWLSNRGACITFHGTMNDIRTKDYWCALGIGTAYVFCERNQIRQPEIIRLTQADKLYHLATCAFYRPETISIMVKKCAHIGTGGAGWSCPGYKVDRTPYGVIQHELGHHVDFVLTQHFGTKFSRMTYTGEPHLTGYKGSGGDYNTTHFYDEWFAEMFRLFVTNPDLLRHLRPETYSHMLKYFWPIVDMSWRKVLDFHDAPQRTIQQAIKLVG